jgi:hypothetical protein
MFPRYSPSFIKTNIYQDMGMDGGLLKVFEFREDQNSTSHETDAIVLFNQTTSTKRNLQLWGLQSLVLLLIIGDLVAGKLKSIMVDVFVIYINKEGRS